jgi:tetratricopeptide (TPR) repeat protein
MASVKNLPAAQPPTAPPPVERLTLGQLWHVPLFLIGLLSAVAVWTTRPLWYDPDTVRLQHALVTARERLDNPRGPVNEVPGLLQEALTRINRLPARAGEVHFLLGSAYARLAQQVPPDRALEEWNRARQHLEQAETLGVPRGDGPALLFRLAKTWMQTDGDPRRVIEFLTRALDQGAEDQAEGYGLLTRAYLHPAVHDVAAALKANEKLLQLPASDENALAPARLLRGELLLGTHDIEGARKVLAYIGPHAPPEIVAHARCLRARSFQETGAWAEAASLWEELLADNRQPPPQPNRVRFFLGVCYYNLHRPADAARVWEQAVPVANEVGQAAAFRLADLLAQGGNLGPVLGLYERAMAGVIGAANYHNSLVDTPQALAMLEGACQRYLQIGDFEKAHRLVALHAVLAPPHAAHLLLAQATAGWGKALRDQALHAKDKDSAVRAEELARSRFREAGAAYEVAASTTPDRAAQCSLLWSAAESYRESRDAAKQLAVLERFIELPPPPDRLGEAWYRLGEAHQVLRQETAAFTAFTQCIECGGVFSLRARYQLALAKYEQHDFKDAEEILEHILALMRDKVDSEAEENTLYLLARILFRLTNYSMARYRWKQALDRYPAHQNALQARYDLAETCRRLADADFSGSNGPSVSPIMEPIRQRSHRQYQSWLEEAAAQYEKIIDDLDARRASAGPLPEAEATLLRKALFELADCRFDRGDYDEAELIYQSLVDRYPDQIHALKALYRLFQCHLLQMTGPDGRTNPVVFRQQQELCHETLKKARSLMNRLDDAAFPEQPESETRHAWERKLDDAGKQLLGPD